MSRFDGLGPAAVARFDRPVHELTREQLTALYVERGIMPAPPMPRPQLRVVRDGEP